MADEVADQVLAVIRQVEIDLETLVKPKPSGGVAEAPSWADDPAGYDAWIKLPNGDTNETNISAYKAGRGDKKSSFLAIEGLLHALYQVKFIEEVGKSVPPLLSKVSETLKDIADKLGALPSGLDIPGAVAGITTFLTAIQKLPGSPQALNDAGDILTQITGLLEDIPSTRLELYRIAQQIDVFAATFASS